jgi:glutathione S-transferase
MLRSYGAKYGYYSSDPMEGWLIDSVIDTVADAQDKNYKWVFAQDGEKKKEFKIEMLCNTLPNLCEYLNIKLEGNKYICGDRITIADFFIWGWVSAWFTNSQSCVHHIFSTIMSEYPNF